MTVLSDYEEVEVCALVEGTAGDLLEVVAEGVLGDVAEGVLEVMAGDVQDEADVHKHCRL